MIKIENYSENILLKDKIYFAKTQREISYPKSGNEACYQLEANSFWFKHRNNCILEAVKKYSPNKHFFDIGGGNGFVAKNLVEHGIKTVLIEPGIDGCVNAQKRGLEYVVCSTLEDAQFKLNAIPSIGLFDVVEHIEHDIEFLTSIFNYLENDGLVYITVPAFKNLWSNEDNDAGHYRRYTTSNLNSKLEKIGFKIVYSSYIFSILPIPVFLFRSLPSKLGFHKNSNDVNKYNEEHKAKKGLINNVLNKIWSWELGKIKVGARIPIGGSCFVVAKKISK
jgi:2-polyprenyl-3-methyl-5-hydroxy-6-metoxy-1,4-benzoquinol methylase